MGIRKGASTGTILAGAEYVLSEYEVMIVTGYASFETTFKFYVAVRKDINTV